MPRSRRDNVPRGASGEVGAIFRLEHDDARPAGGHLRAVYVCGGLEGPSAHERRIGNIAASSGSTSFIGLYLGASGEVRGDVATFQADGVWRLVNEHSQPVDVLTDRQMPAPGRRFGPFTMTKARGLSGPSGEVRGGRGLVPARSL